MGGPGRRRGPFSDERQKRRRLRGHPGAGESRRLGKSPAGKGRRGGRDAPADHREGAEAEGDGAKETASAEGERGPDRGGEDPGPVNVARRRRVGCWSPKRSSLAMSW